MTNFEKAKQISLGFWNRDEYKNVIVALPEGSVWIDCTIEDLTEMAANKKLTLVEVKKNGKVIGEVQADPIKETENETEPAEVKKRGRKKSNP
jgi:hypothetical protein